MHYFGIITLTIFSTAVVGAMAYGRKFPAGNPPPWWLVHLGEMLAVFVMLVLGGMLAFIVYTEQQEQKEREEKYKRKKKNDDSDSEDDEDDNNNSKARRRRRDAGSKTNPM